MVTSICPANARPIARVQEVSVNATLLRLIDTYFFLRAQLTSTMLLWTKATKRGKLGERYVCLLSIGRCMSKITSLFTKQNI